MKYSDDQPRDESGRWTSGGGGGGSDGGAGQMMEYLGGVVPPSDFDDKNIHYVYHGTSREGAEAILDNGLKAAPILGRPPSVYFTTSLDDAKMYARSRIAVNNSDWAAVVEFKIPDDVASMVKRDEVDYHFHDLKNSYRIETDVPSSWITNVTLYDKDELKASKNQLPNIGYAIVLGKNK